MCLDHERHLAVLFSRVTCSQFFFLKSRMYPNRNVSITLPNVVSDYPTSQELAFGSGNNGTGLISPVLKIGLRGIASLSCAFPPVGIL